MSSSESDFSDSSDYSSSQEENKNITLGKQLTTQIQEPDEESQSDDDEHYFSLKWIDPYKYSYIDMQTYLAASERKRLDIIQVFHDYLNSLDQMTMKCAYCLQKDNQLTRDVGMPFVKYLCSIRYSKSGRRRHQNIENHILALCSACFCENIKNKFKKIMRNKYNLNISNISLNMYTYWAISNNLYFIHPKLMEDYPEKCRNCNVSKPLDQLRIVQINKKDKLFCITCAGRM